MFSKFGVVWGRKDKLDKGETGKDRDSQTKLMQNLQFAKERYLHIMKHHAVYN